MTQADVKRFAAVLSVQAEIEGMKVFNLMREQSGESPGYTQFHFSEMADMLRKLSEAKDEEL